MNKMIIIKSKDEIDIMRESGRVTGDFRQIFPHLVVVTGYTIVIFTLAIIAFNRKMNGEKS